MCVFNRQAANQAEPADARKFKKGKMLGLNATAPIFTADVEIARTTRVEAESVAEAQEIVREAFPGNSTGTVVVCTEASFKES